ncbi:MAG: hypothetical protein LAO30_07225 [Acidobacteriia bacterium]|nr:hypothetical protein [Terriglobia bacterium]
MQAWVGLQQTPDGPRSPEISLFGIKLAMKKFVWAMLLVAGCAQAQVDVPTASNADQRQTSAINDDVSSASRAGRKVGLVRGTLKRMDPIHDQLVIHAFGGGDIRIAFDPRTQFVLSENTRTRLTSIPAGSVVSVDTVIENGKLFALSVRTTTRSNAAELNGQVVRYDTVRSQLTLRDPVSPENVSLRITPTTTVINQGQRASPQALSPGMLVRVSFSPTQNAANNVEILAERGASFTFKGRIVALDLRSRVLTLFNDSDHSVRELAISELDAGSLRLLRQDADVSIQAEFDGGRYNIRTVSLSSQNP